MPAVTFADHESFQRSVLRAAAGGAVAGLALHLLGLLGFDAPGLVLALGAVGTAACGHSLKTRLLAGALGAAAGAVPLLFPQHLLFGQAVAGAAMGLLFARARDQESVGTVEVGRPRMGRGAYLAAGLLSSAALVGGSAIIGIFDARALLEAALPGPLAAVARFGLVGFFVSLGGAGAHLARDPDPVEKLYASLLPELTGDLKVLAARAMTNYRRCAEILAGSEPSYAHAQLSKSLSDVTLRILELERRWQAIDRELGQRAEGEIGQRLAETRALREAAKDEIAKKQFGIAEASLASELEQIDRIRRGRERVVARLHGEMALLERTRYALLGLKSSDAHLRAAELSALSESLSSVAREMDCESEAVDEIISRAVDLPGAGEAPSPRDRVRS